MSDEPENPESTCTFPPSDEAAKVNIVAEPPKKKLRKLGVRLKMALLMVIERKRAQPNPGYEEIGKIHGMTAEAVRSLYHDYKKGNIDMGDPASEEEAAMDARVSHERLLKLTRRAKLLLMEKFEMRIVTLEEVLEKRDHDAFHTSELVAVARDISFVNGMRDKLEKGYSNILEEEAARRRREEKRVMGHTVSSGDLDSKLVTLSEEERGLKALAALNNGTIELPHSA